jgi:lysophospholipid acyltransferase (LPLAT)-like uncharacterized protein
MSRARCLAEPFALLLRAQAATWRVETEGVAAFDAALAAGKPVLAVFWHGQYFPLFALLRGRGVSIFTSRCFRGAVIAELCRRFGNRGVEIPAASRGQALEVMRQELAAHPAAALAADGPLGPYHVCKPGTVRLASQLGLAVYPLAIGASRRRVAAARWDRREVPRLFSRVALVVGAPFTVPAGLDAAAARRESRRIAAALTAAERRAAALAQGDGAPRGTVERHGAGPAPGVHQQPLGIAQEIERNPHHGRR